MEGLPMSKYNTIKELGKEKTQEVANQVKSISGFIKLLGYKSNAGGTYGVVKKYLQDYQIDTSHWTGQAWSKNQQLKNWSEYANHQHFKKHLINKRTHKCELCEGCDWRGVPIPLEIHHIDGDRTNNSYENLQLLCPNCHALTDTWRGRNIKKEIDAPSKEKPKQLNICPSCNTSTENKKYCSIECSHLGNRKLKPEKRKTIRPSLDVLKIDLTIMSFCAVGRKYGVSDNCIRKWLKLEQKYSVI